jgi:uncharacterized membrane protein YdfJ with MMPL/SSD domain
VGGVADVVESPAPVGEADLADALLELALDATRLRVRAGAPSLQEATAALHDLACQAVADDNERLQARPAEQAALLETVPSTIQSAPDGPYLVLIVLSALTFLVLPRAFRSPPLAIKAVVLNLATRAAAYGVIVFVWQEGHGSNLIFDLPATGAITDGQRSTSARSSRRPG